MASPCSSESWRRVLSACAINVSRQCGGVGRVGYSASTQDWVPAQPYLAQIPGKLIIVLHVLRLHINAKVGQRIQGVIRGVLTMLGMHFLASPSSLLGNVFTLIDACKLKGATTRGPLTWDCHAGSVDYMRLDPLAQGYKGKLEHVGITLTK